MRLLSVLTTLIVAVLLSGCAAISYLEPARPFDATEYSFAVSAATATTRAIHLCHAEEVGTFQFHIAELNTSTLILDEYLHNKPDSTQLANQVSDVRSMINQILVKDNHFSGAYCLDKLGNIQASLRIIERTMSQQDKYAYCDGGIKTRYDRFTKDHQSNTLSNAEYKELVEDIAKLTNVDTSACEAHKKVELQNDIQFLKTVLPSVLSL